MMKDNLFHHGWLEIDANLEWLIELEYGKLSYEIKNLVFVAFRQNTPLKSRSRLSM